jgi:hypothetical protein
MSSKETTTTVAGEQPATEAKGNGQSVADCVGQKQRPSAPDPFGIANDAVAGVRAASRVPAHADFRSILQRIEIRELSCPGLSCCEGRAVSVGGRH